MLRNIRQRRIIIPSLIFVFTVIILLLLVLRIQAQTTYQILVDSDVDDTMAVLALNTTCDLREAITIVNSGDDTGSDCSFAPGGVPDLSLDDFEIRFQTDGIAMPANATIQLVSALPVITSSLDIAGFRPGPASPLESVALEPDTGVTIGVGLNFGQNGLINADNSNVFGMTVRGFGIGIRVNNVANMQIGRDGPTIANLENYIYDNMFGIDVLGTLANGTVISNNYIGIDETLSPAGNSLDGILVRLGARNTTIGGDPGMTAPNIIGSNGRHGINVANLDTILINGNIIGIEAAGSTNNFANGGDGILVNATIKATVSNNTVGFSGQNGIFVNSSPNTLIDLNSVGTLPNSTVNIGNTLNGITIQSSSGSRVVSGTPGQYGRVFNNGNIGISIGNSQNVTIEDTLINNNGGLGIDLGANGVTLNDGGSDGDSGPNGYLNYPDLGAAGTNGPSLVLNGTLYTSAGNYRMLFYVSPTCDPSNFGEGADFLMDGGLPFVLNTTAGFFNVTLNGGPYPIGSFITALTISDSGASFGNTSEFSRCIPITNATLAASFVPTATTVLPGQSIFFDNTSTGVITDTRWFVDGVLVGTTFDYLAIINRPGTYTVTLEIENSAFPGVIDTASVVITVLSVTPVPSTAVPATPVPPTSVPPVPTTTPIVNPTATFTSIPPTATNIPPTATFIPTATDIPPSATFIPTATDIPPTATLIPTVTDIPPTATFIPTATDIPPTATLIPTVTGTPDLLVTVVGDGADTMSVVVVNAGLNAANNVVVEERLRPGVEYRAAQPGAPICTEVGGIVTCRLGTVAGGSSSDVTINVSTNGESPDSGVTIVSADGVFAQIIDEPYISKIGSPPVAPPGSEITYTIRVINPTNEIATDMLIQDEMPDVIEILDATATAGDLIIDGQSISLSLDELGPGERVILTINALVSDDEEVIESIINTACVTSSSNPLANCAEMSFLAVQILPDTGQISLISLVVRWIAVIGLSGLMMSGILALYWRLRRQ